MRSHPWNAKRALIYGAAFGFIASYRAWPHLSLSLDERGAGALIEVISAMCFGAAIFFAVAKLRNRWAGP